MNIQTTGNSYHRAQRLPTNSGPDSTLASKDKIGEALDNLTLSAFTMGTGALDLGMSVGYLSGTENATFEVAGLCVGAAHAVYGAGNYIAGMNAADNRNPSLAKHRVTVGTGHILSGIGHICGALGAGAWALAPVVGGIAIRSLEDYRVRS